MKTENQKNKNRDVKPASDVNNDSDEDLVIKRKQNKCSEVSGDQPISNKTEMKFKIN